MADGVYVREKSGHIVDTNTALCALSGYTRAELVRMHVRELYVLPETEIQRLLDVSNGAFQVRGEWQLKCKDNQRLPVEVSSGFIGSDRIIAVIHDLRKHTASGTRLHSAERLFALMESEINDVLFSLSVESEEQYRFKFANSAFYRATGLKPHEVVGQPVQAVIPEPSLAQVLKHYRQAIREKRVIHWDETSEYSTGIKHGEVVVMPVFNSQGACTELVGRVHDITERKQHELALERQRNLYAMLSQTNQAIVRLHNRDDLFLAVCHTAVRYGRLQFAAISLLDPQSQQLRLAVKYGADADYLQFAQIFAKPSDVRGRGPAGEAVLTGRHVVCNDFLNDPRTQPWHELARRCGIRASAAFPIRLSGQIIGILSLYASTPDFFTEDMLPTLSEMAGDVSFALDNYAHRADRARLARERDQVFARVADGFLAVNRDWNLTYVNAAAGRIFGSDYAALLGKQLWNVMPREIGDRLRQAFQISMRQQQPAALEVYFDPWKKWYAVNAYPSQDGLTMYFRNITDRKHAEEQERIHRGEIDRISQRLFEVQESERRNLARELHDEIGQSLSLINMKLQEADTLTTEAALKQLLKEASATVIELDGQIGQISLNLHPSVLDDLGLSAAFQWCLRTRLGSDGHKVHLDVEPEISRFSDNVERAVFRVFQESVTNALKYAAATQINVRLVRAEGGKLLLSVSDNGCGFDVAAALQNARNGKSLGLLGMQERARILGGEVAIHSDPGHGTSVQFIVPGQERPIAK
ncbi:MAG: PAS domain S-box protein [Gammaproteobacteria bacterium]|nr:PAS domain S-box protein [Gammaproteobacteria bacterium]